MRTRAAEHHIVSTSLATAGGAPAPLEDEQSQNGTEIDDIFSGLVGGA